MLSKLSWLFVCALAIVETSALHGETLGFVQQKFTHLHFEPGNWARSMQGACYVYTARVDGATVDVLRYGMNNLVPFRAKKGLSIATCGSVATFDEGFEVEMPAGKPSVAAKPNQQ